MEELTRQKMIELKQRANVHQMVMACGIDKLDLTLARQVIAAYLADEDKPLYLFGENTPIGHKMIAYAIVCLYQQRDQNSIIRYIGEYVT